MQTMQVWKLQKKPPKNKINRQFLKIKKPKPQKTWRCVSHVYKNITINWMHDNNNLETNKCFLQNLHSNNNEWNSIIDYVRHYMYSKAERHTLKKKLEKIADQLSFKPKLFFGFWFFFLQRVGTVECNLIEYLCVWNLRQWQFKFVHGTSQEIFSLFFNY